MKGKKADDWYPFWVDKWLFGSTRHEFTHAQRAIWVDLLTLSKKDSGFIRANESVPYPIPQLAGLFSGSVHLVTSTIERAIESGKLKKMDDGTLYVVKTETYVISERHKRRLEKVIMSENVDIVSENVDVLSRARSPSPSYSLPKEDIIIGGCRGETINYTLEQVKDACALLGIPEQNAQSYFDHYGSQGWKKANGQMITELRGHMVKRWNKTKQCWDFDENKTSEGRDKLRPISGKTCSKEGCGMPAVYKSIAGAYDNYLCWDHMPAKVKEKYT